MKTDIKIENREITGILINLMCVKLLLTYPRNMITISGNSAWIQGLYVTLLGFIIFWITDKIYASNKTILDIAEDIGGGIFKKLAAIAVIIVLVSNAAVTLRAYPESVRLVLLQNTPVLFIMSLLCVGVIIGAYNGIESICRINSLFLPLMAAILAIFFLMLIPFFDITNFAPIFGKGAGQIFAGGINSISVFSDIIVLNFLLPHCKSKKDGFKCGYRAIAATAVVMVIILFCLCGIFPESVSSEFVMPVYQLTRMLKIGDFFARFEAFFEFIWSIAMFIHSSVYLYVICNIIKEAFDLKMYKPIIIPVMIICSAAAFLPQSVAQLLNIYNNAMFIIYIFAFILPVLFGLLERIRYH